MPYLIAQCQIDLAVTLSDFNGIVYIFDPHSVIGNVVNLSTTAAALEIARKFGGCPRPDFDAGAVAGVEHGYIVHVDIFYDIRFADILPETANTDAMAA